MRVDKKISEGLARDLDGPILDISNPRQFATLDILRSYFREILLIAGKYARPNVEFEDLVAEGIIGLMDAIVRWDPEKSTGDHSFHQLAIVRIKSCMFDYYLRNNTPYAVPTYMGRAIALLEQIRHILNSNTYPGSPEEDLCIFEGSAFEKAAHPKLVAKLQDLKGRLQNLAKGSERTYAEMVDWLLRIERDIRDFESREEFAVSPEEIVEQREWLETFLRSLKEDAREVIELKINDKLTLEQIGKLKGFTRERARQIIMDSIGYFQQTRMWKQAMEED
ncbi:MAG: sigma-70 family RNA polymerase sigma factor [Nitrospira sp.]|nr:sigma-70 family RNA polymerase sigma factor [Nitrospira sp.]